MISRFNLFPVNERTTYNRESLPYKLVWGTFILLTTFFSLFIIDEPILTYKWFIFVVTHCFLSIFSILAINGDQIRVGSFLYVSYFIILIFSFSFVGMYVPVMTTLLLLIMITGIILGKKSIWLLMFVPAIYGSLSLLKNYGFLPKFDDATSRIFILYWMVSAGALIFVCFVSSFDRFSTALGKTSDKNASLRSSEEKYRSIFESLYDVYYQTDLAGRIIMISPSIKIRAGYEPSAIIGRYVTDFYADPNARNSLLSLLKEKGAIHDFETEMVSSDGKVVNVEVSSKFMLGRKGEPIGIEGSLHDVSKRVESEKKLKESSVSAKLLSAHIHHNFEEERARFSREIHDEIGQEFEAIKMELAQLRNAVTVLALRDRVTKVISNMDDSIGKVRRIAMALRPGILDDLGLISAVEWHGQEFERRTGIKFIFNCSINDLKPDTHLSTNIFRIFQEALSNVEKHSGATVVEVKMELTNGQLVFEIKDNGEGFDVPKARSKATLGLLGIFERISLINGYLSIDSGENIGTHIQLTISIIIN
jgi:PAS domain S-box-containing protein